MKQLVLIAWRNVWRNRLRSSVILSAIAVGLWSGVFIVGLSKGMTEQRRENLINATVSHIQIHHPEFLKEGRLIDTLHWEAELLDFLQGMPGLKAYSPRIVIQAMATTASGGSGVKILGVHPDREKSLSSLADPLQTGDWFDSRKKNQIVVGESLAEKLNLKERSKIVITFQDAHYNIVAAAFRVAGIFKSPSTQYDETHVYIQRKDLDRLMGKPWPAHMVSILVDDFDQIASVKQSLSDRFPDLTVRPWNKVSPELGYENEVLDQWLYIFMAIILLAMAFGIVNTMLMAVLERRHELGMLAAIGMNKLKLFSMILLETLWLCGLGGPLGLLLGWTTILYWGKRGIDLSIVKKGLENYGIQTVVHPALPPEYYLNIFLMILLTAFLAALYPAYCTLKLKPAEATRSW